MILGDWGTSRLRLFRVTPGVPPADWPRREGAGIGALTGPAAAALGAALGDWLGTAPVRLAGMAGARGGLAEVAYVDCPADAGAWRAGAWRGTLAGMPLTIAAGLAMPPGGPPDVMRGEETQIFGALALHPALAQGRQLILHPGTHSKWAVVEAGRITGFRTYFTGELYALLRGSTLTRLAGAEDGADQDRGFADGLARAREGDLLAALFTARAAQLRGGATGSWAHGYLSGLLIGHELAALPGDTAVTLIGAPQLTEAYARALAAAGQGCTRLDGDACVLAGLGLLEER